MAADDSTQLDIDRRLAIMAHAAAHNPDRDGRMHDATMYLASISERSVRDWALDRWVYHLKAAQKQVGSIH